MFKSRSNQFCSYLISSPFISNSAYEACDIAASDFETIFLERNAQWRVKRKWFVTTLIVNAQIFPKSNHYYTLYSQALRSILALQWLVFRRDGSIIISVGHVFFLPLSWVWHVPCNALSSWQNAQCALKIEKSCN